MRKLYPTRKIGLRKKANPKAKARAAKMRKNPTPAEARLWEAIRQEKLGLRFRRQSVIRGWIADFWCPERGLVVEVDGSSHNNRQEYDNFRDSVMQGLGITVLRVTNEEVLNNLPNVLRKIKKA